MDENKKTAAEQVAEAMKNKTVLKLNATDQPEAERQQLIKDHLATILERLKPGDALVVGYVSNYDGLRKEEGEGMLEFIAACDTHFASRVSANLNVSFEIHPVMLMMDMVECKRKPTQKP